MSLFLEDNVCVPGSVTFFQTSVQLNCNQVVYSYPQAGIAIWHWDHNSSDLHTNHSVIKYQNEKIYTFK